MPMKKRIAKRRVTEVSFDERMALLIGDRPDRPQFKTARAAKEAWKLCRDELLGNYIPKHPGRRPRAWWHFDAKEDRDETMTQASQLFRMGEITEEEAQQCRVSWANHERVAYEKYSWHVDYARRPQTGQATYHRWRFEMGIADEILPPTVPRPATGWEAREKDALSVYELDKLAKANGAAKPN